MMKDINQFSLTRTFRFVAYTLSGIALYLAGVELKSSNLQLASVFLGIGGLIGVVRNIIRFRRKRPG